MEVPNLKAQEIRIGNCYDDNGTIKSITAADIVNIFESEDRTWAKAVPLTQDILICCGFRESSIKTCYGLITSDGILRLGMFPNNLFKVNFDNLPIKVLYLHQLQNIYFSLTGEELDVSKLLEIIE